MKVASERGLSSYDMCGFERFKKKFGGTLLTIRRRQKCHGWTARWARRAYEFCWQKQRRLSGLLNRMAANRREA